MHFIFKVLLSLLHLLDNILLCIVKGVPMYPWVRMNYVNRKASLSYVVCNVVSLPIFTQIAIRAPFDYWIHGKTISAEVMQ